MEMLKAIVFVGVSCVAVAAIFPIAWMIMTRWFDFVENWFDNRDTARSIKRRQLARERLDAILASPPNDGK